METHQIIVDLEKRKTAKRYDPTRRISKDKMELIYESLRLSASSINSQPWRFIVLESDQAKSRMGKTFERMFHYNKRQVMDSSHVILFAHNPRYSLEDYAKVVDADITNGRINVEDRDRALEKFAFAELNTDDTGSTAAWAKAQVYLALGNVLHVLTRLDIDPTPMEGIDSKLISIEFEKELEGYVCDVALAMGYHHMDDVNAMLPKSRLAMQDILQVI